MTLEKKEKFGICIKLKLPKISLLREKTFTSITNWGQVETSLCSKIALRRDRSCWIPPLLSHMSQNLTSGSSRKSLPLSQISNASILAKREVILIIATSPNIAIRLTSKAQTWCISKLVGKYLPTSKISLVQSQIYTILVSAFSKYSRIPMLMIKFGISVTRFWMRTLLCLIQLVITKTICPSATKTMSWTSWRATTQGASRSGTNGQAWSWCTLLEHYWWS